MIDKLLENELFQMAFVTIVTIKKAICVYSVLIIVLFYFSIPQMFRLQNCVQVIKLFPSKSYQIVCRLQ